MIFGPLQLFILLTLGYLRYHHTSSQQCSRLECHVYVEFDMHDMRRPKYGSNKN